MPFLYGLTVQGAKASVLRILQGACSIVLYRLRLSQWQPPPLTKGSKMSNSTTASKVAISSPKIANAWSNIANISLIAEKAIADSRGKASIVENTEMEKVTSAILKLSTVMQKESGLTVRDIVKVIKETGAESSFIKVSHVQAIPTWERMRSSVEGFAALPLGKQLSTATASVELLGTGNGETLTLDALQKEIATMRKAKNNKNQKSGDDKPVKSKATRLDAFKAFAALLSSIDELTDSEAEELVTIQFIIEDKFVNA